MERHLGVRNAGAGVSWNYFLIAVSIWSYSRLAIRRQLKRRRFDFFFFDGARRPDFRWWRPPQRWRCQVLWLPSNEMALLIYAQHSSRAIETCLCDGSIRRSPPESAITFECFSFVTFATFRKDPARQWNSAGIELKLLQNCWKSFFVLFSKRIVDDQAMGESGTVRNLHWM